MCRPIYPLVLALLVVAFDLTAGVIGIHAQSSQNSRKHVKVWIFECKEPNHIAFKQGLAALILLSIAHIITNAFSGCTYMCSPSDHNMMSSCLRKVSLFSLICSWLTFLPALVILIIGTYPNRPSRGSCGFSRFPLLSIGGIGCFFHGVWCIGYCLCAAGATHFERKIDAFSEEENLQLQKHHHDSARWQGSC